MAKNHLLPLVSYVPPAVAEAIYHNPTVPSAPSVQFFTAAVLFADVSGFTPLAEALAQKGPEGAEALTRVLNTYFSRMITLIERRAGEVVKFSGDAMMVVFPAPAGQMGDAVRRAQEAAEAMQGAMDEFSRLETIAGPVELGMKIGIGVGQVSAFSVGGEQDKWEYVIAGDPLRQVAEAEHSAERGEIILSPEAKGALSAYPSSGYRSVAIDWEMLSENQIKAAEVALRAYIPEIITSRLAAGQSGWLAELRRLTVLFVSVVQGLDYAQSNAIDRLQAFTHAAQTTILRYEGSINKIAVDDKGTILIGLFGAPPFAHEDDPERALRCALDLQGAARAQGLRLAIGVTTGQVFSGPVGSDTRREYTVMGDIVNLAARLMSVAVKALRQEERENQFRDENGIRCDDETYQAAAGRLTFHQLSPVYVKGKARLIQLYRPIGLGDAGRTIPKENLGVFIGRHAEIIRLKRALADLSAAFTAAPADEPADILPQSWEQKGQVILIEGEAGIGKSRLLQELGRSMEQEGIVRFSGAGLSIEQNTAYRAWRDIFNGFFALDDIGGEDDTTRQGRITEIVQGVAPALLERIPLLNDILGLGLPENDLTRSLDPKLRRESLTSFLIDLLRARTEQIPLVLILEDAHWLDSSSWELALEIARGLADCPLLLIISLRPLRGSRIRMEYIQLQTLSQAETISLDPLNAEEIVDLVAARLGVVGLPAAVAQLVHTRAGGNPFFAEQLAHTLRNSEEVALEQRDGEIHCVIVGELDQLSLPDTVQGLVLSRLDRLPPEEYLTLKVASVIGRTFAYRILRNVYPTEITDQRLNTYLDDLDHRDFTPLQTPETGLGSSGVSDEVFYFFKHIITQEVAYKTLLFSQRRQLHNKIAVWHEGTYGKAGSTGGQDLIALAPYYPLLAYHYQRAEETERERYYCRLAGEQTAAQFANAEAVGYFSRALELLGASDLSKINEILADLPQDEPQQELFALLMAREAVYDRLGERELQFSDLEALLAIAQTREDEYQLRVYDRLALYYEDTGDYPAAKSAAEIGLAVAKKAGNKMAEGEHLNHLASIAWKEGAYEVARDYGQQALTALRAIGERRGEASSLRTLGNICYDLGDPQTAQAYQQQALDIQRAVGDRSGEGASSINLGNAFQTQGDFLTARNHYRRALTIFRTIGYRRGMAYALGSLGRVHRDLGDYTLARDQFAEAVSILQIIGDRWGEAVCRNNIGMVYQALGQNGVACDQSEKALAIQRELGDNYGEASSLTALALALEELEEWPQVVDAQQKALTLRRDSGQQATAIENLAGLARAALAQNDAPKALEYASEILTWLTDSGTEGIEDPLLVYHSLYHVLNATGERDRARSILADAHTLLLDRAEKIDEQPWRDSFLNNVALNQKIIAAWEAANH